MIIIKSRLSSLAKMIKDHGGYFITTFINSSIPLLFLPILTRYLEPAEYANIALFNFYLMISHSLVGTSTSVVISKNFFDKPKEYTAKLVGNSIRIVFLFSLTVSVIIALFYNYISIYLNLPFLWLILIPWASFFYIILNLALTINRNEKKVLVFSYFKIGNTFVNVIISLLLVVVLLWGWQGRITGILVGFFVSALWSLYYLRKNKYLNFTFEKSVIKDILNVILPLIPSSIQYTIISHVGIFFMQLYFSKEILGIYSVGYQIAFSLSLLYTTISFSWNPYVYEELSKKKGINKMQLTRVFYMIVALVLLGVVVLSLFSDLLLKIFTTEDYFAAAEFIFILSIGFFFKGLYVFLLPILMKKEKQKAVSIISFINMCLMISFNILFINLYGYIGIAYAFSTTCFLLFLPIIILVQKVYPMPWIKSILTLKIKSNEQFKNIDNE